MKLYKTLIKLKLSTDDLASEIRQFEQLASSYALYFTHPEVM